MPRRGVLPLVLAGALLVLHAFCYLPWTEDDAGISFRYVVHLASGEGLVYNPGERVEAISNLGYVLLLTPLYALLTLHGGPEPKLLLLLPAKLFGLLAALLGLVEARRLARACGLGGRATLAALALVAGSGSYAAWAVGALETPFVAWASAALVAAAAELARGGDTAAPGGSTPPSRWPERRASLASAGLVLLRPDGFVLPVSLAAFLGLRARTRRAAAAVGLATALSFLAVAAFRLAYYGSPLPNPVHAKVEIGASFTRVPATLGAYILPFLRTHGGAIPLLGLVLIACAEGAPEARARRTTALAVMATLGYAALVGGDWMPLHRFCVPAVIPLAALAAAGAGRVAARLRLPGSLAVVLALSLAAASAEALLGRASFRTRRGVPLFWLDPRLDPMTLHGFWLPAVDWLRREVPADGLLVTSEAGFLPYLSGLRTLDSYGLATPAIARLPSASVMRSSLGVLARFTEEAPAGPAERLLAASGMDAVVLQEGMVRQWNGGRVPESLFGGSLRLVPESPLGGRWAIYVPVNPPGSAPR